MPTKPKKAKVQIPPPAFELKPRNVKEKFYANHIKKVKENKEKAGLVGKEFGDKKNMKDFDYYEKEIKKEKPVIKCGVCRAEIHRVDYTFISNQKTHCVEYCCEKCFRDKKVSPCRVCGGHFSEVLMENHCIGCIKEAPGRYIRGYQEKAEKHHKTIFSKRDEKQILQSEEAQKLFGDNNTNSYVYNAGGVHAILFGIELEYEVPDIKNYGLAVVKLNKILEEENKRKNGLKVIVKRDGTLKNEDGLDDGFEIVSAPADKLYHYNQWDAFFEKISNDNNFYCAPYAPPKLGRERGTGCGCHVHISRDAMMHHTNYGSTNFNGGYGLACDKLQTFIYCKNNRKFVEIIAGRKSNMFSNFTHKRGIQFKTSEDGTTKIIDSGVKHLRDIASRAADRQLDHRTAVNFNSSNGKTIEFRIFRSTKSKDELLKNIDFVDAICAFCRTGNASISEMTDWIYFYDFVCKNRQDYPYLYKFFQGDRNGPGNPDFLKLLENKQNKIDEIEEKDEEPEEINNNLPPHINLPPIPMAPRQGGRAINVNYDPVEFGRMEMVGDENYPVEMQEEIPAGHPEEDRPRDLYVNAANGPMIMNNNYDIVRPANLNMRDLENIIKRAKKEVDRADDVGF